MAFVRTPTAALALVVAATGLTFAGAGVASAAQPFSGKGYVGVALNRDETRILRDVGAGDVLDAVVPVDRLGFYLGEGSIHDRGTGFITATTQQLIDETVARGGRMEFSVNDPAIWGSTVDVIQDW